MGENKSENNVLKHKSNVHCEKKNKFSTVLIKTIFYLRRGNTRREFIGTCKYSVLKILNGGSPREHVKSRRGAARAV